MSEKFDWRSTLKAVVDERRRHLGPHPGHDKLAAYHAGELGDEEGKALQDHLVLCHQCAKLLLELEAFASDASDPLRNAAGPRKGSLRWRWWLPPAAAAAALALLILAWPDPLPQYNPPILSGNVGINRSVPPSADEAASAADETTYIYASGRQLTLKLQPPTALDNPPTARAYLRHGEDFRVLSAATLQVDGNGVISLQGKVGSELLLPSGQSDLIVLAAFPGSLPSRSRLRSQLAGSDSTRGRRWIAYRRKVQVVEPASGSPSEVSQNPWVEYAGCRTILIGPICILDDDQPLILWVKHGQESEIRIHAGGWRDSYAGAPVDGGFRYEIEVGKVQEVAIEVVRDGQRLIWALEVRREPPPQWLGRTLHLLRRGALDEARSVLREQISAVDPDQAGTALSLLARVEGALKEQSQRHLREAIASHQKAGRLLDHIKDAGPISFNLIEERRFAELRELLDSLPVAASGGSAAARHTSAYYRGLLAEETGDLRTALRWMDQAARSAEHADMTLEWFFALDILARQLKTAGLDKAAAALNSRMQPKMSEACQNADSVPDRCDCARFDVNRAWAALLALEAGAPAENLDPSALLAEAEVVFEEESCAFEEDLPNVRLNRALAALHRGDLEEARQHLERSAVDPEAFPRLALWQIDIEARIQLADKQPGRALDLYRKLQRRAAESFSPEAAWRAASGRAAAWEALGHEREAIQACDEAEQLLENESLLVPMHAGRERFIAQREQASRFCLDLLLRADRKEGALNAARRSAARALINLQANARIHDLTGEQRQLWEKALENYTETRSEVEKLAAQIWKGLPRDQQRRLEEEIEAKRRALLDLLDQIASLSGRSGATGQDLALPPQGAMLLAYHPLAHGWVGMAADKEGVTAHRIEDLPSGDDLAGLSAYLLEPFAEGIRRAAEIRVIPYGALRDIDFHALPFDGGILLDQAPVLYHLDLPASADEGLPSYSALVVSGPGLLRALEEARQVERALEESPPGTWRVELLQNPTAKEVRQRLPNAALFHYAGHAQYDQDSRGWGSYLALDGGTRLTVDDILASSGVTRWVVLAGCETSRDSRTAPLPSIGLAQAFLVAGAEAVVAATAEVSDADAAALMESFYERWNPSTSMAAALQEAQIELKRSNPDSDWSKFRILARSLP